MVLAVRQQAVGRDLRAGSVYASHTGGWSAELNLSRLLPEELVQIQPCPSFAEIAQVVPLLWGRELTERIGRALV